MKSFAKSPAVRSLLLTLCVLFALVIPVLAQSTTPSDDDVNRIAKQLYCPVCENTPLDVCPTEACHQWRELIRTMLSEGKNEAEIKDYFVAQYGARVLNEPPNRLMTYLIPTVAILLGAGMLFRGFQLWLRPVKTEAATDEEAAEAIQQDAYVAQLEEELKKRK